MHSCGNCYGIALIHTLARFFAKLLLRHVADFAYANKLHTDCQAGFRPKLRLEDNATILTVLLQ